MEQDLLKKQVIEPYHIYLSFFAFALFFALVLMCMSPEDKITKFKQKKIPNLINKQARAINKNQSIGKYQFPNIYEVPVKKQTLIPKQTFAQKQRQLHNIYTNDATKFRDPNHYMLQKTKNLQRNIINKTIYSAKYMKNQYEVLENYEARKYQIKKSLIRSKKYHQYRPFIEVCREKIQEQRQRNKWVGMNLRQYLRSLSNQQYSSSSSDPSGPSVGFPFDNLSSIDKKSQKNLKYFQQEIDYGMIEQQYHSSDKFEKQYEVQMGAKQNYKHENKPAFWAQEKIQVWPQQMKEKNQVPYGYQNMAWNVYQTNINVPQKHLNYNISVYPNNKVEYNQYEHLSQMGSNVQQNNLGMDRHVSLMNPNAEYNNIDINRPAMGSNVEQNNLGLNRSEMRSNVEQNSLDVTKPVIWSEVEMQIVPDDF